MDYPYLSSPAMSVDIVGQESDENPHKRARVGSLFGDADTKWEKSGWTSDPIVSNEDNAQSAPSTVSVFSSTNPTDSQIPAKRHSVYPIHIDPSKQTATPDFDMPLEFTLEHTAWKFGVLLTSVETDGTALVSVQWHFAPKDQLPHSHPWPGVLLEWQENHGIGKGFLCTFGVQHATIVNLGSQAQDWEVGRTLFIKTTVSRPFSPDELTRFKDAAVAATGALQIKNASFDYVDTDTSRKTVNGRIADGIAELKTAIDNSVREYRLLTDNVAKGTWKRLKFSSLYLAFVSLTQQMEKARYTTSEDLRKFYHDVHVLEEDAYNLVTTIASSNTVARDTKVALDQFKEQWGAEYAVLTTSYQDMRAEMS